MSEAPSALSSDAATPAEPSATQPVARISRALRELQSYNNPASHDTTLTKQDKKRSVSTAPRATPRARKKTKIADTESSLESLTELPEPVQSEDSGAMLDVVGADLRLAVSIAPASPQLKMASTQRHSVLFEDDSDSEGEDSTAPASIRGSYASATEQFSSTLWADHLQILIRLQEQEKVFNIQSMSGNLVVRRLVLALLNLGNINETTAKLAVEEFLETVPGLTAGTVQSIMERYNRSWRTYSTAEDCDWWAHQLATKPVISRTHIQFVHSNWRAMVHANVNMRSLYSSWIIRPENDPRTSSLTLRLFQDRVRDLVPGDVKLHLGQRRQSDKGVETKIAAQQGAVRVDYGAGFSHGVTPIALNSAVAQAPSSPVQSLAPNQKPQSGAASAPVAAEVAAAAAPAAEPRTSQRVHKDSLKYQAEESISNSASRSKSKSRKQRASVAVVGQEEEKEAEEEEQEEEEEDEEQEEEEKKDLEAGLMPPCVTAVIGRNQRSAGDWIKQLQLCKLEGPLPFAPEVTAATDAFPLVVVTPPFSDHLALMRSLKSSSTSSFPAFRSYEVNSLGLQQHGRAIYTEAVSAPVADIVVKSEDDQAPAAALNRMAAAAAAVQSDDAFSDVEILDEPNRSPAETSLRRKEVAHATRRVLNHSAAVSSQQVAAHLDACWAAAESKQAAPECPAAMKDRPYANNKAFNETWLGVQEINRWKKDRLNSAAARDGLIPVRPDFFAADYVGHLHPGKFHDDAASLIDRCPRDDALSPEEKSHPTAVQAVPFLGVRTEFAFYKQAFGHFNLHTEQENLPFYHYQLYGTSIWWVFHPDQQHKFVRMAADLLRTLHPSDAFTDDHWLIAGKIALLSKQIFPAPSLLRKHKIEWEEVTLQAGQAFIGWGNLAHCGFGTSPGETVAFACNLSTAATLKRDSCGPKHITEHFEWVKELSKIDSRTREKLLAHTRLDQVDVALAVNHAPPNHICMQLRGVQQDLQLLALPAPDLLVRYKGVDEQTRKDLLQQIAVALDAIHAVTPWMQKNYCSTKTFCPLEAFGVCRFDNKKKTHKLQ